MPRPVADVYFPLSDSAPQKVQRVEIIQREFHHDMARVRINREVPTFPDYRSNTPVEIEWGNDEGSETFYGYVHHVEPSVDRLREYLTVVCIGSSYPMKQRRQLIYREQTVTDVVSEIADRHRLDADIEPHAQIRSVITQSGESDWELLVRLAREIGYVVYCNQTQLRFHTRTRDISAFRDEAPRFGFARSNENDQGDVQSFDSQIGETLPLAGRRADRYAFGVDPFTADLVSARNNGDLEDVLGVETADPFFDYYETDLVIHDSDTGDVRLDGITEDNRFHIRARAVVRGNTRVRQAMPVYLAELPEDYGGYWFVHAVTHVIGDEKYDMDLTLGRDSLQIADDVPDQRPRRDLSFLPGKGKGGKTAKPGRVRPPTKKPTTRLNSPTGGGKKKPKPPNKGPKKKAPKGKKPKKKVKSPRTPRKGHRKVTGHAPKKKTSPKPSPHKQPGTVGARPPRGARTVSPPKPVRSTTPQRAHAPAVVQAKPPALWQAEHRSQPIRVVTVPPKPAAVVQRLAKVVARAGKR